MTLSSVLLGPGTGWGYWTAPAFGQGTASTGTLTAPSGVTATVAAWTDTVAVSWTPAATSTGADPAGGYHVTRVRESDGAVTAVCEASAGTQTADCEDSTVPDGAYRYRVTAVHNSWTAVSSVSDLVAVDADFAAPTVAVTDVLPAANGNDWHNVSPVTLTLAAQDSGGSQVASITYSIDGAPPTTVAASTVEVHVSGEGAHTISYSALDAAGNPSGAVDPYMMRIDTIAPGVTVQQADAQVDPSNTSPVYFTVTFSEPVTGFTAADVELSGTAGATTAQVTGSSDTYEVVVSGMAGDGTVVVSIPANAAHDPAGNGNTTSTSTDNNVTRDATAPAPPSAPMLHSGSDSGTSDTDQITNVTAPTFTGTAEPGSTVTLYSNGVAVGSGVATNGNYSIATSTLAEGDLTITAESTDAAGNTSALSPGAVVTIDITAPAAPSAPDMTASTDSGAFDTDNITNVLTPTFAGTAVVGSTVTLYSDGVAVGSDVAVGESYSITTSTLSEGERQPAITATATDVAGNSSPSPTTTVFIDTIAPVVAITSFTQDGDTAVTTGTGSTGWRGSPTLTVKICTSDTTCTSSNTEYTLTADVATDGTWTVTSGNIEYPNLLGVPIGSTTVWAHVTQTDLAGNTGTTVVSTNSLTFGL